MAPTQEKDVRTNLVMPTIDHLGRWNQFALKRTEKMVILVSIRSEKNMKKTFYTQTFLGLPFFIVFLMFLVGCCHRAHIEELSCVL